MKGHIPSVLFDLEGVEVGRYLSCGERERHVPVKHLDGRVGRRIFARTGYCSGGLAYVQQYPIKWRDPVCNKCARPESHPVHHGVDGPWKEEDE